MSHHKSPVFALNPTHCSCCGRALTDAVSVDYGIGPICRDKYGFGDAPQVTADMVSKAAMILDGLSDHGLAAKVLDAIHDGDSRKAVNVLNYAVAIWAKNCQNADDVKVCIHVMNQLGFTRLASKISSRVMQIVINITVDDGQIFLKTPYLPDFVVDVKKIQGKKWHGDKKMWSVPATSKKAAWDALKKHYPGMLGNGPQGVFEIPA